MNHLAGHGDPRGDTAREIPLVAVPHFAAGQLFLRGTLRGSRLPSNKPEGLALLSGATIRIGTKLSKR
jgi:hypothetical protein